jgi:hypothetical protein
LIAFRSAKCQLQGLRILTNMIDCGFYMLEHLRNLFGFHYIMNALNLVDIQNKSDIRYALNKNYPIKFKLFQNLSEMLRMLSNGNLIHLKTEALIPNLYPLAFLLHDYSNIQRPKIETFLLNLDVHLEQARRLNGENLKQNFTCYLKKESENSMSTSKECFFKCNVKSYDAELCSLNLFNNV